MKEYRTIPIQECGEPLVPIPKDLFILLDPPPYMALGADYHGGSPWILRKGVLDGLTAAQQRLQVLHPGWRLMIFDAYRPNAVQIFMVEREFTLRAATAGLNPHDPADRAVLSPLVFKYWSIPSDDPLTPPPHSTGAVVDITLANEHGREVNMGSKIDEGTPPADPDYFAKAEDESGCEAHANRCLLRDILCAEGFHQHPDEWWHFSRGDQFWAWLERETGSNPTATALYGRADLLLQM